MKTLTNDTLVAIILALQFAAFGWRINREIGVGDEGRRTWLPVPDIFNVLSMFSVVLLCVVLPLAGIETRSDIVLAIAYTLMALHPITMAAHYRLFTREGRGKYTRLKRDWPYITDLEWIAIVVTVVAVLVIFVTMYWNGYLEMNDPNVIVSILAFLLASASFVISLWQSWRSEMISRRPILSIQYVGDSGWHLQNVGNGPALNILVAQKSGGIGRPGKWFNPVRVPPLGNNESFHMKWLGHVNTTGIGAIYEDFNGRTYTSTCGADLVRLLVGNRIGMWKETEIGRHWNHPTYQE